MQDKCKLGDCKKVTQEGGTSKIHNQTKCQHVDKCILQPSPASHRNTVHGNRNMMASHIDTATFPGVKKMNIGVLAAHRIKELTFFSKKTRKYEPPTGCLFRLGRGADIRE